MKFAQILNNSVHWVFSADVRPEFAPDIIIIDITDISPQPAEGWLYDGVTFTAPEPTAPTQQRPCIILNGVVSSNPDATSVNGMSDITCPINTSLSFDASIVGEGMAVIPVSASFRMPVQSRDGREFVVLAQFFNGVAEITVPFTQSGVWSVTEAAINSALPPEQQMSFAGFTVYVVV